MATAEFSAKAGALRATAKPSGAIGLTASDATAADTAVGTVVTDHTTAFTDLDTFGAAVVAITGDTYSATTHQFTFGGATGLTHAQWATVGAQLNTAITDFKTAKTDAATAKTATALVVTDASAVDSGADVTVRIGSLTNVSSFDILVNCLRQIERTISGTGIMAVGQGNPRNP